MQPQPPWEGQSTPPLPGQQYPAAYTSHPYQSYMYSAPPVYSTTESGNGAPRYSYPTYHQTQGYTDINQQKWHGCEPVPDQRYGEMWHTDYREAAAASSSYGVMNEAPYRPVECDTHNRRDSPSEAEAGTVSQSGSEPGKKHDDTYSTQYQELSSVDLILAEKQPSYHQHQTIAEQRIPKAVCPAPSSERGNMKESPVECAPAITRSEYTDSFLAKVQKFVVRNAEVFDAISERSDVAPLMPTLHDEKTEDSRESCCVYCLFI